MNIRYVLIVIVTLLDEAVVVVLVLWGLPRLGIVIPLPMLVLIFTLLAVYAIVTYRLIVRALIKKPVVGLSSMVGATGEAITNLTPKGTVRIKGELWHAVSDSGEIEAGELVTVVAQDGLKLTVRRTAQNDKPANRN